MILALSQWLAKVDLKSKENTKPLKRNKLSHVTPVFVVDFDLPHISQAIAVCPLSWAFCENCLSVFCEFFHGMIAGMPQWVPRVFYGAPGVVTAFFGYFF